MSINLMPWRQERRKQLQKDFLIKIGLSATTAIGCVVLGAIVFSTLISGEKKRISFLETNIAAAEKDIEEIKSLEKKRQQMLGRKNVIEKLQSDRDQLPNLMYELATKVVDGVTVKSVAYKNKILTIEGSSTSQSAVASYINNLEQSPWISNPEIIIIQNKDGLPIAAKAAGASNALSNRYSFNYVIRTNVINPNAPKTENDEQVTEVAQPTDRRKRT